MNKNGQHVHNRQRFLTRLLSTFVLPFILSFLSTIAIFSLNAAPLSPALSRSSVSASDNQIPATTEQTEFQIEFIYNPDSKTEIELVEKIQLLLKEKNIPLDITHNSILSSQKKAHIDLVIAIGKKIIKQAIDQYKHNKMLLVSPTPVTKEIAGADKSSYFFMSQPYCRQMGFIRLINPSFKTIGLLESGASGIDMGMLEQCAHENQLSIYTVMSEKGRLTDHVRQVLKHSDTLLALPDLKIYNRKTVKPVLLTSYRLRKPVIGFSNSFVNAGAAAAIYSNLQQIADSITRLIIQIRNHQAITDINYPDDFSISINKQVFRALDLPVPDPLLIKEALKQSLVKKDPQPNDPSQATE